jgi:hypothetical protein
MGANTATRTAWSATQSQSIGLLVLLGLPLLLEGLADLLARGLLRGLVRHGYLLVLENLQRGCHEDEGP